jgi:hypothetical protein
MFATESRDAARRDPDLAPGHATPDAETGAPPEANPLWSRLSTRTQAQVAMSVPGDAHEHEADGAADAVVHDNVPAITPRASGVGAAAPDGLVPARPGERLDADLLSFMESRFGHDFGDVRIHTNRDAARSVHARAYTVGSDVVFDEGQYQPRNSGGRALLAHELAHVVQQRRAPGITVFRQTAPTPRDPTVDEIAQEIGSSLGGPYADYASFAATMVSGSFLGHAISGGVRPEFLAKLKTAKTNIDAEFAKSGTPIPPGYGITAVGGFRSQAGPHGWGLAIDIDVAGNPYVMHEHGEATLDAQLAPVYHRIAEFMLNSPVGGEQSIIPTNITQGKSMTGTPGQSRADRLGEYYDRLAVESEAMKVYFALMNDPAPTAIDKFLAGPWKTKHPGATPPAAADVRLQMWEDYATLGGKIPKGGPPGVTGYRAPGAIGAHEDRPFAPHSGSQQDPAAGFLTIPREVVIGLGRTVTRWGAIDFGGESGDIQHFDDMGSLGTAITSATARAKAKIAAAATSP